MFLKGFKFLVTVFCFSISFPAFAAKIYLKNGDILTGDIIQKTKESIFFTPVFSKDITMDISLGQIDKMDIPKAESNADTVKSVTSSPKSTAAPTQIPLPKTYKTVYKKTGHLKSGLNITTGNTDTKAYDVDGKISLENDLRRISLVALYGFSEQDNAAIRDQARGTLAHDYFLSKNLYHFTNLDLERDKFQNLSLRTAFGTGLGYQIYNEDHLKLSLQGGPNYVLENYTSGNADNEYLAFRWGADYEQKINDYMTIYHNHKGLQSLETRQDIIINARTGIRLPIFDAIQAGIEWRVDWNNSPATGRDSMDQGYIATLGYYF